MEAKSIERIAEELGVNFYDLHPLIAARDEFHRKASIKEVVEWIKSYTGEGFIHYNEGDEKRIDIPKEEWQAKLKEWGIR